RIAPGKSAVVATMGDDGYAVAADLAAAGVEVRAVVDSRPEALLPERLQGAVGRHIPNGIVEAARGARALSAVRVTSPGGGASQEFGCDLLALSLGLEPANALLAQAGARLAFDNGVGAFVPEALPAGVLAAGAVTGVQGLAPLIADGERVGQEAARLAGG